MSTPFISSKIANARFSRAMIEPVSYSGVIELAGGSDPAAFGDFAIEGVTVRRLQTGAAAPFFRVTFPNLVGPLLQATPRDKRFVITGNGRAVADTDDLTVTFRYGATAGDFVTAVPAAAPDIGREFDFVVNNGGTAVDTAGIAVMISMIFDRVSGESI